MGGRVLCIDGTVLVGDAELKEKAEAMDGGSTLFPFSYA